MVECHLQTFMEHSTSSYREVVLGGACGTRRFLLIIICGLVWPSSTFTVREAESAGHSETTDRRSHEIRQLNSKWKKNETNTSLVSTTLYTDYALAQTFP